MRSQTLPDGMTWEDCRKCGGLNIITPSPSVKPDVFYERAAAAAPGGRLLELFARRPRPGWSVWGNEVVSDFTFDESRRDRATG